MYTVQIKIQNHLTQGLFLSYLIASERTLAGENIGFTKRFSEDGSQTRDFIFIEDVVKALLLVAESINL